MLEFVCREGAGSGTRVLKRRQALGLGFGITVARFGLISFLPRPKLFHTIINKLL